MVLLPLVVFVLGQPPVTAAEVERRMAALGRLQEAAKIAAGRDRCGEVDDRDPLVTPFDVQWARGSCIALRLAKQDATVPLERRCPVLRRHVHEAGVDDAVATPVLAECLAEWARALDGQCEAIPAMKEDFKTVSFQAHPAWRAAERACFAKAWRERVVPLMKAGRCEDGVDLAHAIDPGLELMASVACDAPAPWLSGAEEAPEWHPGDVSGAVDCEKQAAREARWRQGQPRPTVVLPPR